MDRKLLEQRGTSPNLLPRIDIAFCFDRAVVSYVAPHPSLELAGFTCTVNPGGNEGHVDVYFGLLFSWRLRRAVRKVLLELEFELTEQPHGTE